MIYRRDTKHEGNSWKEGTDEKLKRRACLEPKGRHNIYITAQSDRQIKTDGQLNIIYKTRNTETTESKPRNTERCTDIAKTGKAKRSSAMIALLF